MRRSIPAPAGIGPGFHGDPRNDLFASQGRWVRLATGGNSGSESGASVAVPRTDIAAVIDAAIRPPYLRTDVCERALNARDARFDGVFFVGITTTRIYCRPVCPSRFAASAHRRFFNSAAAAERAGFRPCLRCRPELAPGRPWVNAVQHLAATAAHRINAGDLNGRSVAALARELGVSERHLRRALERELGVSPVELAQTHRLLLAKRLLADTGLSVTQIAFASGFQSVRRFNCAFREHYRMPPTAVRRATAAEAGVARSGRNVAAPRDFVRLTLGYRPPLAWDALLASLQRDATPCVDAIDGQRYGRTVRMGEHRGVVLVGDATAAARRVRGVGQPHLQVDVSTTLVPALMPLLARLRQLFDLDAEPAVIDAHLEQGGLGALVAKRPGMRVPGAMDGFDIALRALLGGLGHSTTGTERAGRVASALGEAIETGVPALTRLAPSAPRLAEAGPERLVELGVAPRRARSIVQLARLVADGALRLEPGGDAFAAHRTLAELDGVGERLATLILMRAQRWPDAFPASDPALRRAVAIPSPSALLARAEQWRPWRAYAAMHLWLDGLED